MWPAALLVLTSLGISNALAQGTKRICPLQGQQFPAPTRLSNESLFHNATRLIENTIKANLTQGPYNVTTCSIGMFSTDEDGLLYEFHHTDPGVASSGNGTNKADADSIYRVASITKIFTIYLWLIHDGDRKFSSPITDFIPELAQFEQTPLDYATPAWSEVTIGEVMMYLAGLARDYGLNDVAIPGYLEAAINRTHEMAAQELPNNPGNGIDVPMSADPTCGYLTANTTYIPCQTREAYLHGISTLAASFPGGYTPLYSNANFALLGLALANLAGRPEEVLFNETLAKTLGLTGSTFANPQGIPNKAVIPFGNPTAAGWDNALGPLNGAAGAFSTTNDLAKIGRSILNSTLISKAVTRRWFSTTTFVDTIDQAVGRGWEIFRRRLDGHTVDLYSKSGYWGDYTSVIFLIPDYNFGFSLLSASANATGHLTQSLPNLLVDSILPALETIARQQAHRNFAGVYTNEASNSTVRIETNHIPALKLTEYTSNSIDLLDSVFTLFGDDIDFRLVPNHLYRGNDVGFTGIYQPPTSVPAKKDFYWPCQSWLDIDDFTYASVPLGQMVFEVDDSGRACAVQVKALRQRLARKQV